MTSENDVFGKDNRFSARPIEERHTQSDPKPLGEYRGEFRVSGELSAGHFRYDSGLRDRSAGFERFWKLISIAELAEPLAVELLYMRLLAEASLPSLCP